MLHVMMYKYLGEKTVQMKRCVLSIVHANMTAKALLEAKNVSEAMYRSNRLKLFALWLLNEASLSLLGYS